MIENKTEQARTYLISSSERDIETLVRRFGEARRIEIEQLYLDKLIVQLSTEPKQVDFIPHLIYNNLGILLQKGRAKDTYSQASK